MFYVWNIYNSSIDWDGDEKYHTRTLDKIDTPEILVYILRNRPQDIVILTTDTCIYALDSPS